MPARPRYRIALKQTSAGPEVCVRFPGVTEPEFRDRLARLGGYLAVLSDDEYREFGLAILAALAA